MEPYERNEEEEEEEEESFFYAMNLQNSTALAMCLQTTVELGIFQILAKAGEGAKLSASEVVAKMPTNNPDAPVMVDRILRWLASYSVLGCSLDGEGSNFRRLYSLSPVSKHFVTNEDDISSVVSFAPKHHKLSLECWSQLKDTVLEGGTPFNRAHGMSIFEYALLDPGFNEALNTNMYNHTVKLMKKILQFYKGFDNLGILVDVGGGLGVALNFIISAYPQIKGINFDLPHVINDAPSYPGVEHVDGDMFERVPTGDAIFMKCILHDWNDETCLKLLKNCYRAIPENGKVIVIERIIPVMPETNNNAFKNNVLHDVLMMTHSPGGKERSQQEFLAFATAAGYRGIKFECCVRNYWVMEFFK